MSKNKLIDAEKLMDASTSSGLKKQWPIVGVILLLAFFVAFLLMFFKPHAEKKIVQSKPPVAEFVIADLKSMAISVASQGSVKAKIEIKLIAQVSGRVTQIAKLKFAGGFFKKGDLLLSIDDTDYRLAMRRAQAQVAAAKQQLIKVEIEATQAKFDLQQIGRDPSKSSAYALRQPQLAEAQASLQAAQADLEISRLQMQRTQVIAPFDGRVVSKQVDVGQYVSAGTLLSDIYSTETVTVRLPLSLAQTELLGITLRVNHQLFDVLKIKLFAQYATQKYQWDAQFSHTEGKIDVRNRLVYLVAEVASPYDRQDENNDRPPLTPGMFVKAELLGLEKKLIKLPRSALRYNSHIWLISDDNKLIIQAAKVLAKDRSYFYLSPPQNKNLNFIGAKVIINSIDYPVDGMLLEPLLVNTSLEKSSLENASDEVNMKSKK